MNKDTENRVKIVLAQVQTKMNADIFGFAEAFHRKSPIQWKKVKVTFVTLLVIGWILAILLIFYPNLPGPTQMVDAIYKPLGKLLEK